MEAQSNKPHRKPKEKKKHAGGTFHRESSLHVQVLRFVAPRAGLLIDRIFPQTIPKPLQYTGPANFKHKLRDRRISKKSVFMFLSSTDFPMNRHLGSWPSSARPAWARRPFLRV